MLVLGWGSTYGAIKGAVRRVRLRGKKVDSAHLHHLNPLPRNTGEVVRVLPKVLIPEMNTGQLASIIRAEFLVDAMSYTKVEGLPIFAEELDDVITERYERRPTDQRVQRRAPLGLTKKDFASDQETRWCPGCGDYAILATVQQFLPELGLPPERIVFVAGIGCAGRFAYYMNTYGVHGIHGRAPALATGLATGPPGPLDLGGERRRRRALDRRQPPDPRAAAQRADQGPPLQQSDLRPDQGPVLADQRGGQGHQVDPVRLARPPLQPGRPGARRGGDLRRAHCRHRPRPPSRRAARGSGPRGIGPGRDLPELQRLQRRRLRRRPGKGKEANQIRLED